MENEKLKPCPFCGGEAEINRVNKSTVLPQYKVYYCYCKQCGCATGACATEKLAAVAWNTRKSVNVASIVHGKWIRVESSDMVTGKAYMCSNCYKMRYGSFIPLYCQMCGAKMDS